MGGLLQCNIHQLSSRSETLFDFGFLEFDVLPGDWIIFPLDHFVGHCAAVFLGYVIKSGVSRALELDLDCGCLGHGYFLSV